MSRSAHPTDRVCGSLGCHNTAAVRIELADGRVRVVCDDHSTDGEVIDHV